MTKYTDKIKLSTQLKKKDPIEEKYASLHALQTFTKFQEARGNNKKVY